MLLSIFRFIQKAINWTQIGKLESFLLVKISESGFVEMLEHGYDLTNDKKKDDSLPYSFKTN